MNRFVLSAALACAASLTPGISVGQTANLNAELLKDWTEQKALMVKTAAAMPEEKFWYKSTAPQRDFGEQILHVAGGNIAYLRFFGGKAPTPAFNRTATSKREMLKALARLVRLRGSIDQGTDRPIDAANHPDQPVSRSFVESARDLFPDRSHVGYLRPNSGIPAIERRHPTSKSAALTRFPPAGTVDTGRLLESEPATAWWSWAPP